MPPQGPVQNELRALGARIPVAYNYVSPRPFLFGGVISDAAVTAADLTLAAGIFDQELKANYGGSADNPMIMLLIEQFKIEFEAGVETGALLADTLEQVYIHHLAAGGRSTYIQVNQFASYANTASVGADAVQLNRNRPAYLLPTPWLVNLNNDTFEVAPRNAIDYTAGGGMPFTLTCYGYAWSVAQGAGRPLECPDGAQASALEISQRRVPIVTR